MPDRIEAPKTSDVFFAGDLGATPRLDCVAELEALAAEGYRIDYSAVRVSRKEFYRRMASAWIALSPSGYGWDCARHYEAPAVGTVPLINYPTVVRDMPLIEGEHCLFYSPEPGGLAAAVRAALADKARLARIAEAAHAHVRAHHTIAARAERVTIAVLGRRLDGSAVKPD